MKLTAEKLRSVLDYEPETGNFRWKEKLAQRVNVGDLLGTIGPNNNRIVGLFGKRYQLHRLAFLWMTGKWPPKLVDHINRDRSDNRWANLRSATPSQNTANSIKRNKKQLPKGVTMDRGKFRARIRINGKEIFVGNFRRVEEAHSAYACTAKKYFGEYARVE